VFPEIAGVNTHVYNNLICELRKAILQYQNSMLVVMRNILFRCIIGGNSLESLLLFRNGACFDVVVLLCAKFVVLVLARSGALGALSLVSALF